MSTPNSNLLVSGNGEIFMQNLAIQGNSIVATNTNGSIEFVPNGTGVIGFGSIGLNNGVISTTQLNQRLNLAPNGTGNVGIKTENPGTDLDVNGTMRHKGFVLSEGTVPNVDEKKTFTKNSLTLSTSAWTDIGISGTDLADGSYLIQVYSDNYALGHYTMTFTGYMSWFSSNTTNSTEYNEILLHNAGHAMNGNPLYVRTQMQGTPGYLKLQAKLYITGGSGNYTFKFRRLL